MRTTTMLQSAIRNYRSAIATLLCVVGFASLATAAGPDLTNGTTRFTINTSFTFCLGPTGLRGWIYKDEGPIYLDRITSVAPWQILVTSVGTGTPALAAGLQTNDVILGARAGGGTVAAFTNDSRVELGNAINDAEATNGILRLLVNRYLVATNQTFTLQLNMSNMSYSATAPYNCPKSALILSNALKVLSAKSIGRSEAMALLASGEERYLTNQVMTYARSICPGGYVAPWPEYGGAESVWEMGYRTMFLAEYYMVTNDPQVVNGLTQRAVMLARSDTMYGSYCHGAANVYPYHTAAGVHGTSDGGYGPVNACGLPCNVGVALAKRTGLPGVVTNAEVQPAITRAHNNYNYLVYKGGVNYGDMEPNNEYVQWGSQGKNGIAALLFAAIGGKSTQVQYFSRLAMAGWADMETGHGGNGIARHWQPLGANMGGTNAMATFMANRRWCDALTRRCDGSFSYDCIGDSVYTSAGYWDYVSYANYFDPTAWNALHLACAKQKLLITGRNADPTNTLNAVAISNDMWAAAYPLIKGTYTTNQLLGHLGEFHPSVRKFAALELAVRPGSNTLVAPLLTLATNASPWVREAACQALGYIGITNAIVTLAGRMYDPDTYVRFRANFALDSFGSKTSFQLTNMMNAFAQFAVADPITGGINWNDPFGHANGMWNGGLVRLLFVTLASSTMGQSTNILYPALRAGLRQPDGGASGQMGTVLNNDSYWPWSRVKDLAPDLITKALRVHQANNMWGDCREEAVALLARNRVEEAIPLSLMAKPYRTTGPAGNINNLNIYRGAASNTVPSLLTWSNYYANAGNTSLVAMIASTIATVVNDTTPRVVTNFKTFASTVASPGSLTLPASNSALSTLVTDLDGNPPKYTWTRKSGPDTVTFSQNASTASSNTTATFTTPGTYVLQASVCDSVINSSNYWVDTHFWFDTLKMWTNEYGSVTTTVTVTVYGDPFVNITNPNFAVGMTAAQAMIGGTNTTAVVGGMRLTCVAGGTTNYTLSFAATSPWSVMATNLVSDMTNYVTIIGTNGMGVESSDTIEIYRRALALIDITNSVDTVVLPAGSNTWRIAGTNNFRVVGGMVWTNAAIGGVNGIVSPASGNWSFNVNPLVAGFNVVTIYGTNSGGDQVVDSVTIVKGEPPMIDITNLTTTGVLMMPSTAANQYLAGTNTSVVVGGMRWTNGLGGANGIVNRPGGTGWNCSPTLNYGTNIGIVYGTNIGNYVVADTVTIFRATAPFVDITTTNVSINMTINAMLIAGTNNVAPVGGMRLTSVTGATTNYAASMPVVTPWTIMVSNLVAGVTNFVTMTATNIVGESASDTVQIFRRPLAFVDVTNVTGVLVAPSTSNTWGIRGTNSLLVVGGMRWTNSLGGGGTVTRPIATSWNFNANLAMGVNVITIWGTNAFGDIASDIATIARGLGGVNIPAMSGMIAWVKADAVDTNDTAEEVRLSAGTIYIKQWDDQSFYRHHASGAVESRQPQYITNVLNGKPVLRFAQSGDSEGSRLRLGDLSDHFPSAASMFIVAKPNSDGRYNLFGNRVQDERWVADTWSESKPGSFRTAPDYDYWSYSAWPQSNAHVFTLESDTVVYRMLLNGVTNLGYSTPSFHNGAGVSWSIGNGPNEGWPSGDQQFNGDMPELILYNRVLSSNEAALVGQHLADKYGLTSSYAKVAWMPTATMLHFGSSSNQATIADSNVTWTVLYGTPLTNLAPAYMLSAGATCDIPSGAISDFSSPVNYTVVSADLTSTNVYTVTVVVAPASSAKSFVWFGPSGIVGTNTVFLRVPFGTGLSYLAPTYAVSPYATCDPASGTILDFTTPQQYTIVAQDGSTNIYTVTVDASPVPTFNVNFDATPQTGLVGPIGGSGDAWNHVLASPCTISNLVNYLGVTTTVSFACTADGMDTWGTPALVMLRSAARCFGWNAPYTLTINGLGVGRKYDIYIASHYPSENGSKGQFVTANTTIGPSTNYIDNGGPGGVDNSWIEGTNYIRFLDVSPNGGGTITFNIIGRDNCRAMVSGFQIVQITPLPLVDITNITGIIVVTNTVSSQNVAGVNNAATVGSMWWTNLAGGGGVVTSLTGKWSFSAPLAFGHNTISISGTNLYGDISSDSVVVFRNTSPFVDITNANGSVGTPQAMIGGTNNEGTLGFVTLTSVANGITNYSSSAPATSPWTLFVGNLQPGLTNFVTVAVTNGFDQWASDTVEIFYRTPPFVDITNLPGVYSVPGDTTSQYVAGTNSPYTAGGMWWANSVGGSGTITPSAGAWSFNAPLSCGNNIITVSGSNLFGDFSADTVTVYRTVQLPVLDSLVVWLKADAIDTNDTVNEVRFDGSNTFVKRWDDQTYYYHHATNDVDAYQPQYIAAAIHGQPVLRFTEVDSVIGSKMFLGDLSEHFPAAATLFVVGAPNNDGRYNLFGNRRIDERWVADTWSESTPGSFRVNRGNFTSVYSSWPTNGSHIFTLESDSAVYRMLLNGTTLTNNAPEYDCGLNMNWTIGNRVAWPGNDAQFRGDIPELLLYNRVLSAAEAAKVGRYLADKYGLATAYPPLAPEATMLQFGFPPTNHVTVTGTNVAWELPPGTSLASLAPVYVLSAGARCTIASGATNNFTSPVPYTVISSDDAVTNVYTVTASTRPPGTGCDILALGPGAVMIGTEISWRVPYGTVVSSLSPVYTMSPYASGNPASGSARDFSSPQTYTVVAEDQLSSNVYTVTVLVSPQPWINVNFDAVVQTGLVGPDGGSGAVWNDALSCPWDCTNALDSAGVATTVRIVCSADGIDPWDHPPQFSMLRSAARNFGWNAPYQLTLYGLDPLKKYDLYIAGYYPNENGSVTRYVTANVSSGPSTNLINNGGANGNDDTWILGTNYIRFVELVPTASSNVTISVVGLSGCRAMISGFQLVTVTPPHVRITNVTGTITVSNSVTTQYIAGTNNSYTVGGIAWTNSLGDGGSVAPGTWNFTANLYPGENVISVKGTNSVGDIATHAVTVIRAVPPYVDITNANFTVDMNTSATTIGGTNNSPGPVGNMRLTSVTGTATNYAAVLPAVTPWTSAVSNLVAGMTNYVTMTVTNGVGQTASDTVWIYRRPLGIVDITNVAGSIYTTNVVQKIAGTNNPYIVGGMIWSNSMGGGAKFAPSTTTGWTFNVTLSNAANVITVWGTNTAGDVASDSVTVMPPSASNDILSCSFGQWGNATISGTNISITVLPVAPISNLAPTFTISDYATINPPSGSTNDFTTPKFYTVTSQSGSNKQYNVTVTTWPYRGSLYVLTTPQGANLPGSAFETNFPLLVRLSTNNFTFIQAQTNGSDIRFYLPNGTMLPHQIEEWNTNAGTAVWVLMPFIKGNTNQEFRMCWGLASVTNESSSTAVFKTANGYACVMHLNRNVQDATGSCAPTNNGAVTSTAVIGSAAYNLTNGSVSCANATNFPAGINPPSTSVLWLRARDIAGWAMPLCWGNKVSYGWNTWEMQIGFWGSPEQILPASLSCRGPAQVVSSTRIEKDRWYHVVYTTSNGTGKVYIDGQLDGTASGGSITITNPQSFSLSGGDGSDYDVDEMRISSLIRAADWIKMEYENQKILQTAVGPIVQPGTNFSVSPSSVTMNENSTTNFTAQAGGAIKMYWVKREAGVDTLLAVDQPTLTYTAGRVVDNQSFSIQLRAVYLSGVVLTSDTPVTVLNSIPEPVFTLLPSTNLWDGRSVMTVKTNISNWAALLASGYTNLSYTWSVAGVAVTKVITPGLLTLTRSQGSGPMTVTLVMDNGGAKITNSTIVTVQEPTNEAWIVRTPGATEKPVNNQFFARDDSGYGTLFYNGNQPGTSPNAFLKVYTNSVLYTNIVQTLVGGNYAFTAKLPAGLIQHTVEYGTNAAVLATVTNIVCGDAYIVDGQSNAESNPDDGAEPNPYTNLWIRNYGLTLGWGYGTRDGSMDEHKIGHWQMDIASNIVALYGMPVCFINTAWGGTRIDEHLPGATKAIFEELTNRVTMAKLTHGIRGAFWHQGENNSGVDGPDGDYDYKFYQQYFVDMTAAWKGIMPNLYYYYLFQVYPRPCAMGPKGDQIREVQRTLPRMFSHMQIMSTIGNQPPVGCHTTRAGYLMFANLMGPLVKQDMYGYVPGTPITAPDVKSVYFTTTNKTAITLVFGQNVIWKNSATNLFYLNYQAGKVASGSVASNVITLQLTAPTTNTTITYVNDAIWNASMTNWMIYGSNGIAALSFADVSIAPQPPLTNLPGDVELFVAGRGADYGQVSLSWSNGAVTVLACTNRLYSTNAADWFALASGVATPWTHTAASNFPSVYYRIVSGTYTSQYAVGKYDVNIAPGSIAWLSFPFGVQLGCDVLSEWFGQQLEPRDYSSFIFVSLQRQTTPGGTVENSDYYVDIATTNWVPDRTIAANAGYVLFLPQDHGAVKVTGIGMVQTNNVTMQLPYNSIPWVGLAYDVVIDMRQSGLTNMLQPPRLYSTFNYDFVDSQQTPGGPIWYAEYYQDNWGGNTINFFPSATGADKLEPGKGYLLFFSTGRAGTGTWTCVKPY